MSEKKYKRLKEKSAAADLSANAWLMAQMETNRPILYREQETWELIHFMDKAGREINAIAKKFNNGYGTAKYLRRRVQFLCEMYKHIHTLRKKGYLRAS